jgi:hypothetical protein
MEAAAFASYNKIQMQKVVFTRVQDFQKAFNAILTPAMRGNYRRTDLDKSRNMRLRQVERFLSIWRNNKLSLLRRLYCVLE